VWQCFRFWGKIFSSSETFNQRVDVYVFPVQGVPEPVSLGINWPGREDDHTPPTSSKVRNAWSYIFTLPYFFMVWCLVKERDIFASYVLLCPLINQDTNINRWDTFKVTYFKLTRREQYWTATHHRNLRLPASNSGRATLGSESNNRDIKWWDA